MELVMAVQTVKNANEDTADTFIESDFKVTDQKTHPPSNSVVKTLLHTRSEIANVLVDVGFGT